jgi:uncharacterized protein (TIGR02996 family)
LTNETVEALHRHLDAHPEDSHCRLVLADALEEIGSPLAEGYRALGERGIVPSFVQEKWWFTSDRRPDCWGLTGFSERELVPEFWLRGCCVNSYLDHFIAPTRRGAEDRLAEEFARLSDQEKGWVRSGTQVLTQGK